METLANEKKQAKTPGDNPEFFGAYLNMARHNLFMLTNHLANAFPFIPCEKIDDDGTIARKPHFLATIFDSQSPSITHETRHTIVNYLVKRHHLPLLKYFEKKQSENEKPDQDKLFNDIHRFLTGSFAVLNRLRDSYTHYLTVDKQTGQPLEREREAAEIKNDLNGLFREAPHFSLLTHRETQHEEDFVHLENVFYALFEPQSGKLTANGLYFFICLFLERKHAIRFLKKFRGFKNENTPPFRATLKAFSAYCIKVPGEKIVNDNPALSLLMDMLNELGRCPRPLFDRLTENDRAKFEAKHDATARQNVVLNSIRYEDLDVHEVENAIRELSTHKRHEDRFPYFALRFLDETNAFQNIRFQICLGRLFVREYTKELLREEPRRITRTIKTFGRLTDFQDENALTEIMRDAGPKYSDAVFEQFHPHYHISNNNIAFYVFSDNDSKQKHPRFDGDEKANRPTGFISTNVLHKLVTLCLLRPGEAERLILDFIKKNENNLLDHDFLESIKNQCQFEPESLTRRRMENKRLETLEDRVQQLRKKTHYGPNEKIQLARQAVETEKNKRKDYLDYLEKRSEQLNRLLKPYELQMNELPTVVGDYLMNINSPAPEKLMHLHIQRQRDETKRLLKTIRKELSKPKVEQKLKLGELSTYLAYDIADMVIDLEVKQKITTPYHRRLQNLLSYFGTNKEDIIALCEKMRLFDVGKGHVFLTRNLIKNANGIIDFYVSYLVAKQGETVEKRKRPGWFDKLAYNYRENGKPKTDYRLTQTSIPYSYISRFEKLKKQHEQQTKGISQWLANKKNMPVFMPITLFDGKLNEILAPEKSPNGFNQLLADYLNNDAQPFYAYRRAYMFGKKIGEEMQYEEKIIDVSLQSIKELKETYGQKVADTEKAIRHERTKDRVQLLMCRTLLASNINLNIKGSQVLLQNIYPNSPNSPLDLPVVFEQTYGTKKIIGKNTSAQVKEVEAWHNLPAHEKLPEKRKGYTWTAKDFGRFKSIFYDRRLKDLLGYAEPQEISYELLEFELDEYEKYWDKFFNEIFTIEKSIEAKDYNTLLEIHIEKSNYQQLQFIIYIEWLKRKNIEHEPLLKTIRNKFSHSQFPPNIPELKITQRQCQDFINSLYQIKENKIEHKSLSEQIHSMYQNKVAELVNKINNA